MAGLFLPTDETSPYGQGDVIVVPQLLFLAESELPAGATSHSESPTPGHPYGQRVPIWKSGATGSPVWAQANLTVGLILTHGCAIDKDTNRLARFLEREEGLAADAAMAQAMAQAEVFLQFAEVRRMSDVPAYQRVTQDQLGYMVLNDIPEFPADQGPWLVDFSRVTTASWDCVTSRLAIATDRFRYRLQGALCQHYAARNVEVTQKLQEIFAKRIMKAESLTADDAAQPGSKMKIRLTFEDDTVATLEGKLSGPGVDGGAKLPPGPLKK